MTTTVPILDAPHQQLLTPAEAAKFLRVSREKIFDWIHSGKLMASNVGRGRKLPRWRIRSVDLDDLLESLQPAPPEPRGRRRKRDESIIEFYK